MTCKIAWAQTNPLVGAVKANCQAILTLIQEAKSEYQADLIIFPELALTGYPLEDLLFRPNLYEQVEAALLDIQTASDDITIVIGHPSRLSNLSELKTLSGCQAYNTASVFQNQALLGQYHKQCLPNYKVFDERRYFLPGNEAFAFSVNDCRFGLTICEDLWNEAPAKATAKLGINALININASPFHNNKQQERLQLVETTSQAINCPIFYVNLVGGQDELVFDGRSVVTDKTGQTLFEDKAFATSLSCVSFSHDIVTAKSQHLTSPARSKDEQDIYQALVMGVRDYVTKNGFKDVVIGLSGGIDSALTLAVAVDALGHEHVEVIMLPSQFTSQLSLNVAAAIAKNLNVQYSEIAIDSIYDSFSQSLAPRFAGKAIDLTEQNLQARARGMLLMAIANKENKLVLSTGNKSELAVGYSTLYGDMAGAYCVLKDVTKHWVYRLSNFVNEQAGKELIPQAIIDRPPSAELAPDQLDEDNLPPYHLLDQILEAYVEQNQPREALIAAGFDATVVDRVIRMIKINEYKRFQSPPGPRVTSQGFGKDWRYPMTAGFKD